MSATKTTRKPVPSTVPTTEDEIKASAPTTPKGKTADEMGIPRKRSLSPEARVRKLDSIAKTVLTLTGKAAEITAKIAVQLLDAEALFLDAEGKATTLTFTVNGVEDELTFNEWAMAKAGINRSSLGEYLQTARVLRDNPALEGKIVGTRQGAMIESALRRKPTKAAAIIAALPASASIAEAKAVVAKHAPKAPGKAPDTTKAEEALKAAVDKDATTEFLGVLRHVESDAGVEAIRGLIASVVEYATSPEYGKGAAYTAVVLDGIYSDTVARLAAMRARNEERKAAKAAKAAAAK